MLKDNNAYGMWVEDDLALLLEALQGAGSDLGTLAPPRRIVATWARLAA
jgi:hypothetical protein